MTFFRRNMLALAVAVPALLPQTRAFAAEAYAIDPSHTAILFEINHFGFSTVHGSFRKFSGELALDEAAPEKSSVSFTIEAASIDTAWKERDDHIRTADFLNVEKFPSITFKSTAVKLTGEKTADVTGDLTIAGVTKPVTLAVTLNQIGENPVYKVKTVGFSATTTIKRSEFGVAAYAPAIGDEMPIRIDMEASPAAK